MNQIQRQGKDMLEVIEKYEVPQEYHAALWDAYERGAEMGFWKAYEATTKVTDLVATSPETTTEPLKSAPKSTNDKEETK